MHKEEFLTQLREALHGNVSQKLLNENLTYYENYILQEVRKGKTEGEVLSELGNPRILAQTIIDTQNLKSTRETHNEFRGEGRPEHEEDMTRHSAWSTEKRAKWFLIATIAAIILVVIGILSMIAGIISFLAPILVPLLIIMIIVRVVGRQR